MGARHRVHAAGYLSRQVPVMGACLFLWLERLKTAGRSGPEKMPMAALRLLAVHAYCLRRRALPSTFFRPAWPGKPGLATWGVTYFAGLLLMQESPMARR